MNRQPLDKVLRRALESTVVKARDIAEQAATQAIRRLGVGDAKPADYLNDEQRKLRTRLRAHGRQLGDSKDANGQQTIHKLVTEVAYEHWHRMLFARFLEQNNLLMYDEHTPLTLAECNELVQDPDVARDELERRCQSGWELAGVLASKMLPQIFRIDSPVFELEFAPEHQRSLEQLVTGLALETFQAQDSLGWVYQFWQSKRKEEVNKSELKIGADELSPVTQLFTESYMVSFLLDNSLGAWWAGQRLSESDWQLASSEQELREKAAIPGVQLSYLRFVKDETTQQWQPASGTFEAWPKQLSELKALDPCCGSGHFLVAAFLMLVPMRMQADNLTAQQAIDRALSDNLHGLELDQRCVELAAFAVALEAWRYPDAGGYRSLPELHLACSGLSIVAARDEWKELSRKAGKQNLTIALDWMYQTFQDAPVLGSLINPRRNKAAQIAQWSDLQQLLGEALSQEQSKQHSAADADVSAHTNRMEAGIVAQGLAKAAELLAGQYTWVITNVPYLARGKQNDTLKEYCEAYYPAGKNDLATVFLDRCLEFCVQGGTASIVLPQNWLFLTSYRKFREKLLQNDSWHLIARLGPGAFETISGEVVKAILINLSHGSAAGLSSDLLHSGEQGNWIRGVDVSEPRTAAQKAAGLLADDVKSVEQVKQLENPDARFTLEPGSEISLMSEYVGSYQGITTGDNPRFIFTFWETNSITGDWCTFQSTGDVPLFYSGRHQVFLWENGQGYLATSGAARIQGQNAWARKGISVRQMSGLPPTLNSGSPWDMNCATLVPNSEEHLGAVWCFCSSPEYSTAVRRIDQKLNVTNATLVKVPFDLNYWTKVSEEQYPNGLPQPYTNDPTQWIFHGHPCGSVIWDDQTKWTTHGELRIDDSVLQVAVARLLGYRWPAELDAVMELAAEQRALVLRCQELEAYADDDGIVCLPAVRGEKAADQRLEALLQAAYGVAWTTPLKNRLLEAVGSKSLSLWLRDKFFEQHCKLFLHRPFILHIWDGLKDGFSALVNYHKLNKAGLERLIYTYLGDWIRTQQVGMASGEDGAQERLLAAEALKRELEAILEGEVPYDIFVRWKPLVEQPIGWTPNLNDGVRLNIRPFIKARDVGRVGAGILRWAPNIKWTKDRGKDVESAPWYTLGLQYDEGEGARINDHHLSLAEKQAARK
ncbi:restriction endonuclease subunit M [Pseudomonas lundensis]|uniref:Eco57I restriction-modification methylase domain-containing protein n=1 Tax=Pseudomonas lundensis TaxID=86185 RepID=UPI0006421967|nr:N-6 DNA methylase [Pseudomonas lundensis]AOZ12437.1 restriction endonuclease subunit M [Pseudomonas lundensis]QVQ76467.1 N-6 DNA methylase [Pseudomonas lundensis]QVQ80542.1 N-6 DNA methylase [Pseudomonas lundensis]